MGQKTHPLGFRLGITQEHKSTWYSNFNQYANVLEEDDKIRTYIDTIAKSNNGFKVIINGENEQAAASTNVLTRRDLIKYTKGTTIIKLTKKANKAIVLDLSCCLHSLQVVCW